MGITKSRFSDMHEDPPEKLHDFKKLAAVPEQYSIPEVPYKRQPTDKPFLIIFLTALAVLLICVIYTLACADIRRYTRGFDNCGNLCGEENPHVYGVNCSGKDYTDFPYLEYKTLQVDENGYPLKRCVNECRGGTRVGNRCYVRDIMSDFETDNNIEAVMSSTESSTSSKPTSEKSDSTKSEKSSGSEEARSEKGDSAKPKSVGNSDSAAKSASENSEPVKSKSEHGDSSKSTVETNDSAQSKSENSDSAKSKSENSDSVKSTSGISDAAKPKSEHSDVSKSTSEGKDSTKSNSEHSDSTKSKSETGDSVKSTSESGDSTKPKPSSESSGPTKAKSENSESGNAKGDSQNPESKNSQPPTETMVTETVVIEDLQEDDNYVVIEFCMDVWHGIHFVFLLMFVAVAVSYALLLLFRYATACVVWVNILGCYGLLVITTIYFWFPNNIDETGSAKYFGAMILTILTIFVTIFLISIFKRIPLVINIFREAVKAIFAMPLLILKPLVSCTLILIIVLLFLVTLEYASTSGSLTKIADNSYTYEPNGFMIFTLIFDGIMVVWLIKVIFACQTMVVSGAVSAWYFSRDKTFLGSPIKDSFTNMIKFHVGTAVFGSLLSLALVLLKALIRALSMNRKIKILVTSCLDIALRILAYISDNAYIVTAMHGENYMRSGRRAIRLLYMNFRDMIAINSIGDFVLFMAKLFVTVFCLIIGAAMLGNRTEYSDSAVKAIVLALLMAIFVANSVFLLFEIAIDTIFLCYCEDCAINDGLERPYYMSDELRQFFEESKSVVVAPHKYKEEEIVQ